MSGRYDMTTDPSTWPRPDDVDIIQAQERFEQTDAFIEAALDWLTGDANTIAVVADAFTQTAAYDRAFDRWMAEGGK